jgi:hypothetical protein
MKLEKSLQPNCSELAIQFNNPDVCEVIETLRGNGFKVVLSYNGKDYSKLKPEVMELFVREFRDCSGTATMDKCQKLLALGTLPKELKEALLKDKHEDSDCPETFITYKGSVANFQIGDYCGGGGHVAAQIGDCDQEHFKLFKKIEKLALGEVYTVDGGHDDSYQAYKGRRNR